MQDQNRNLILATALSFLVILVWFVLFPPPEPVTDPNATAPTAQAPAEGGTDIALLPPAATDGTPALPEAEAATAAAPEAPRVRIDTPEVEGSISLIGGRIDDLSLRGYFETLDEDSPIVRLLSPVGSAEPYYALYGWVPGGSTSLGFEDVPGANTEWSVESGEVLTPETPVTLVWDNGSGLIFRRIIEIDANFMFSVTQSVENTSGATVRLAPMASSPDMACPMTCRISSSCTKVWCARSTVNWTRSATTTCPTSTSCRAKPPPPRWSRSRRMAGSDLPTNTG